MGLRTPLYSKHVAIDARIVENLESMRRSSRAGAIPPEEIVDPRRALHEMRLHKTPEELEILRRGAAITYEAHHEAAKLSHEGIQEYEVEADREAEIGRLVKVMDITRLAGIAALTIQAKSESSAEADQ